MTIDVEEAKAYKEQHKGRYPGQKGQQVVQILKEAKKEDKKIAAVRRDEQKAVVQRQRVDLFLEEFLSNGGNATNAAMKIFNCKNRSTAAALGSDYLKRARDIGRLYMEKQGITYGKLLDIAMEKMVDAKDPAWWDRFMKIAGYHDFLNKEKNAPTNVVNIVATEKDVLAKYVEEEIEGIYVEEEITDDTA